MTFLKRFRFLTQNVTSLKTNGQLVGSGETVQQKHQGKDFYPLALKNFGSLFLSTRLVAQWVSEDDFVQALHC